MPSWLVDYSGGRSIFVSALLVGLSDRRSDPAVHGLETRPKTERVSRRNSGAFAGWLFAFLPFQCGVLFQRCPDCHGGRPFLLGDAGIFRPSERFERALRGRDAGDGRPHPQLRRDCFWRSLRHSVSARRPPPALRARAAYHGGRLALFFPPASIPAAQYPPPPGPGSPLGGSP